MFYNWHLLTSCGFDDASSFLCRHHCHGILSDPLHRSFLRLLRVPTAIHLPPLPGVRHFLPLVSVHSHMSVSPVTSGSKCPYLFHLNSGILKNISHFGSYKQMTCSCMLVGLTGATRYSCLEDPHGVLSSLLDVTLIFYFLQWHSVICPTSSHKWNLIIFWPLLPLFLPRLSSLSSLCTVCGAHVGPLEIWHFFLLFYPAGLHSFLFVQNKFHCHPADCDSPCRIRFKYNHVTSPRKPSRYLSILAVSLSSVFLCHSVCISTMTLETGY